MKFAETETKRNKQESGEIAAGGALEKTDSNLAPN